MKVCRNHFNLKNSNLFLKEDFSQEVEKERMFLLPIFHHCNKTDKQTRLTQNKTIYQGNEYSMKNTFANSESLFQFRKAMFARDPATALRRVNSNDPLEAKKLGDSVDVTTEDWIKVSRTDMNETLFAKYEQNPNLKKLLVSTGNRKIVECNKYDKI